VAQRGQHDRDAQQAVVRLERRQVKRGLRGRLPPRAAAAVSARAAWRSAGCHDVAAPGAPEFASVRHARCHGIRSPGCWADNEPAHLRASQRRPYTHACSSTGRSTQRIQSSESAGRAALKQRGSLSTLDRCVDSSARLGRPSSGPALSGAPCAASAEPREAWRASIAQVSMPAALCLPALAAAAALCRAHASGSPRTSSGTTRGRSLQSMQPDRRSTGRGRKRCGASQVHQVAACAVADLCYRGWPSCTPRRLACRCCPCTAAHAPASPLARAPQSTRRKCRSCPFWRRERSTRASTPVATGRARQAARRAAAYACASTADANLFAPLCAALVCCATQGK